MAPLCQFNLVSKLKFPYYRYHFLNFRSPLQRNLRPKRRATFGRKQDDFGSFVAGPLSRVSMKKLLQFAPHERKIGTLLHSTASFSRFSSMAQVRSLTHTPFCFLRFCPIPFFNVSHTFITITMAPIQYSESHSIEEPKLTHLTSVQFWERGTTCPRYLSLDENPQRRSRFRRTPSGSRI